MTKDSRLGSDPLTWLKDEVESQPQGEPPENGTDDVLDFLGQSEPRWSRAEVLENVPTPVCVASLLGEMLWANPAFFTLSGHEPAALVDLNWRDIFGSPSDQNLGRRKVKSSKNKSYGSTLATADGTSLDIIINRFFGKAAGLDEGYFFAAVELPAPPPEPEIIERVVEVEKIVEIEKVVEVAPEPAPPLRQWSLEGLPATQAAELLAGQDPPQGKKAALAAEARAEFLGLVQAEAEMLGAQRLGPEALCQLLADVLPDTLPDFDVELELKADDLSAGRALAIAWVVVCLGWPADPVKEAEKAEKKLKKDKHKHEGDEPGGEQELEPERDEDIMPQTPPLQLKISAIPDGGCQLRAWGHGLPPKLKLGKGGPMDMLARSLAAAGGGLLCVRGEENEVIALF